MKRPTNDFWAQIAHLADNLSSVTYYEILGLEPGAEAGDIRSSYERQVRAVHPDRHARETSQERKQGLTRVYARIGEAFRVLHHPTLRAEYDGGLATGKLRHRKSRADTHRGAIADPKHPQAKSLFEQAQALIARDDIRAARSKLELARQYQPDSEAIDEALAHCDAIEKKRRPNPVVGAEATPKPSPAAAEGAEVQSSEPAVQPQAKATVEDGAKTQLIPRLQSEAPASAEHAPQDETPAARIHPRVPMGKSIEVSCEAWQHVTSLYMQDISRGGMLLRCDEVLDIGAVLELSLQAPDGDTIELPAEVVRHVAPVSERQRPAIGVRFLVIPEDVKESFELLLRAAGIPLDAAEAMPPPPGGFELSEDEQQLVTTIRKALELIDSGEAREAIPMLQLAVHSHPDNAMVRATFHIAAGLTSRDLGLPVPARHHFERALHYDSNSIEILRHLRED